MSALDRLVARYHQQYLRLQAAAASAAAAIFDEVAGPTDAELDLWLRSVAPIAAASRQTTVDLVTAYLNAYTRLAGAGDTAIDRTAVLAGLRGGLGLDEEYTRPIVQLRTMLSEGADYHAAFAGGRARATNLASTDVVLAQRDAAAAGLAGNRQVAGYRRVLTGRSCAFCATASTQRYHSAQLMPIHPHCDCGIAPIVGDRDPGRVINQQLLTDLKSQGGSKYWEGRFTVDESGVIRHPDGGGPLEVTVHQHGELGGLLGDAEQHFTGPGGIAA